jgi:hypothetical protein
MEPLTFKINGSRVISYEYDNDKKTYRFYDKHGLPICEVGCDDEMTYEKLIERFGDI